MNRFILPWLLALLASAGCAAVHTDPSLPQALRFQAEPASLGQPPHRTEAAALRAEKASRTDRGLAVYREQYCGTCHTLARAATSGTFGPTHDDFADIAAARLSEDGYSGHATTVRDYVRESIVEPGVYLSPGYEQTRFHMPAYTQLTPDELDALVDFLLAAD